LQSEIEDGSWFATRATPEFVFHDNPANVWSELLKRASQRSVRASTLLPGRRPRAVRGRGIPVEHTSTSLPTA
jgi:hypothetical protein